MSTKSTSTNRRFDLDWLRVLAILSVFLYHSTRFFNLEDWHVKNLGTYPSIELLTNSLDAWEMPLIFVISGASLFYALGKGGAGKFLKDKVLRLLVPLEVAAFTHVSLQVYLERLTHGDFQGSFFEFLPHYFEGIYLFGGNFAWMGLHLWYLLILFFFCVAFLPLLLWLKRGSGKHALARLGDFLALPGAFYLLALPVILSIKAVDPDSFWGDNLLGGWSITSHACFFLSGFLIISNERLQKSIRRLRWISLAGASLVMGVYIVTGDHRDLVPWFVILAILGFGMEHLNFNTPFLQYSNEAVLPFYILHQTVLICVGYTVLQWTIPDPVKWLVISTGSFILSIGTYEYLVRRNSLIRFLFGMKPLAASPAPQLAEAVRANL